MAELEELRTEVYRGLQSLMLKRSDVTIDRLARVFKVQALLTAIISVIIITLFTAES